MSLSACVPVRRTKRPPRASFTAVASTKNRQPNQAWLEGYYLVRLAFAPFIYGTKLKVEFLILNCLTGMTQQRAELRHLSLPTGAHADEATLSAAEMAAADVLERGVADCRGRGGEFRAYGISATDWDDDVEAGDGDGGREGAGCTLTTYHTTPQHTHTPKPKGVAKYKPGNACASWVAERDLVGESRPHAHTKPQSQCSLFRETSLSASPEA